MRGSVTGMDDAQKVSPIEFVHARLYEDERELVKDPPHGLGYANLSARMRREITVKRAILAMAEGQPGRDLPEGVHDGRDPDEQECDEAIKNVLKDVACVLAAVWSDHPDHDPEWTP